MPPVIKTLWIPEIEIKRAAIELREVGVFLSTIRAELNLHEATLCCILAHARQNPENPAPLREVGSWRPGGVKAQEAGEIILRRDGTTNYKYVCNIMWKHLFFKFASVINRKIADQSIFNSLTVSKLLVDFIAKTGTLVSTVLCGMFISYINVVTCPHWLTNLQC